MNLTSTQKDTFHLQVLNGAGKAADAAGNPVKTQGVPTMAVDNPIVSLFPTDDGLNCTVVAIGVGTFNITISGQSLNGTKFTFTISGTVTLDPSDPSTEAASFAVSFDPPVSQ